MMRPNFAASFLDGASVGRDDEAADDWVGRGRRARHGAGRQDSDERGSAGTVICSALRAELRPSCSSSMA